MIKFNDHVTGFFYKDSYKDNNGKDVSILITGVEATAVVDGVASSVNIKVRLFASNNHSEVEETGIEVIDDVLRALAQHGVIDYSGMVRLSVVALSYRKLDRNDGKTVITVDIPEGIVVPFHKILGDRLYAEDICDAEWNVVGTNYIFQFGKVSYPVEINGDEFTISSDASYLITSLISEHGYAYKGGRFQIVKL